MRKIFLKYTTRVKPSPLKGTRCKSILVILLERFRETGSSLKGVQGEEWIWGRN